MLFNFFRCTCIDGIYYTISREILSYILPITYVLSFLLVYILYIDDDYKCLTYKIPIENVYMYTC